MTKHNSAFTLIELLIVITIIAILAGAAIPYVQQYVDDARYAKVKQDLDEISKALVRYETDQNRPYDDTTLSRLVGPYLTKNLIDPWGGPYIVAPASSTCYSVGPDRIDGSGDEIKQSFRPPLALTRAFWEDTNTSGTIDTGDSLIVKFTRPIADPGGPVLADFNFSGSAPANAFSAKVLSDASMTVRLTLDFGANPPFSVGKDTLNVVSPNTIVDLDGNQARADQETVIKARN